MPVSFYKSCATAEARGLKTRWRGGKRSVDISAITLHPARRERRRGQHSESLLLASALPLSLTSPEPVSQIVPLSDAIDCRPVLVDSVRLSR